MIKIVTIIISIVLLSLFLWLHMYLKHKKVNEFKDKKSKNTITELFKEYVFLFISLLFLIVVVSTTISLIWK